MLSDRPGTLLKAAGLTQIKGIDSSRCLPRLLLSKGVHRHIFISLLTFFVVSVFLFLALSRKRKEEKEGGKKRGKEGVRE